MSGDGLIRGSFYEGISVFLEDGKDGEEFGAPRLCLINRAVHELELSQTPLLVTLLMGSMIRGERYERGEIARLEMWDFRRQFMRKKPEELEFGKVSAKFTDDARPATQFEGHIVVTKDLIFTNIFVVRLCSGETCVVGDDTYQEGEFITRTPVHIQSLSR